MTPIAAGDVELDWCPKCRGIWFDRGELASAARVKGEPTITRDHPVTRCPACRANRRGGDLWSSSVAGTEVMACLNCGGCFVTAAALAKRGRGRGALAATFVCSACGDRYPLQDAVEERDALRCRRCVPQPASAAGTPLPGLIESLLLLFRR